MIFLTVCYAQNSTGLLTKNSIKNNNSYINDTNFFNLNLLVINLLNKKLITVIIAETNMEAAIEILGKSRYNEIVELIDKEEFIKDPIDAYENKIFCKGAPMKTAVVWNEKYVDFER